MSVKTLHASEVAAGRAIMLPESTIEAIIEAQETRYVDLGALAVRMDNGDVRHIDAWRGISGPDDGSMDKGGSRMTDVDPAGDLRALPQDMWAKLHQVGLTDPDGDPLNGGKSIFNIGQNELTHTEKVRMFAAAGQAMFEKGRAGHDKSVPAGDMGTNHTDYMDAYADAVRESGVPLSEASITGKSPSRGGLEFRPHATGHGVYLAADHVRRQLDLDGPARLVISGAGNVGGYLSYYASKDPNFSVRGFSDIGGTLYIENTDKAAGIRVDEGALAIMDNADFGHDPRFVLYKGDKLRALRDYLREHQPELDVRLDDDSGYVMEVGSDLFVPASVRGLVDGDAANRLKSKAIVEAGNDTITSEGYEQLAERGIAVVPGTIANAGGVYVSMIEHRKGVTAEQFSFDETKVMAAEGAQQRISRLQLAAELLKTNDNLLASSVLGVAGMARQLGHRIPRDVEDILESHAGVRTA